MKNIINNVLLILLVMLAVTSCDKTKDLAAFNNGSAVVLSSSATTIAPAPADSNNVAATFSWTTPKYAQDSSLYKYVLQIDSAGKDFSKAYSKVIVGSLDTSLLNKDLNTVALNYGFAFNTAYDMDVRVVSSYGNNNEQLVSNVVRISYTPYKVPPKVALPAAGKLFLVGDATQGGWNNPVPLPTQEFSRLDETTFAGVFNLVGGKQYLVLPENGDWGHKYSIESSSLPSASGDFGYDFPKNFNGPDADGWYLIVLNFQTGKYSVTSYSSFVPDNLFIVGDATDGGWSNPVPLPSQQFTRINSSEFSLTLPITGGKEYLFLPQNGDWGHKYAVEDKSLPGLSAGGKFGYDFSQNFPGPANSGTYTIHVNFANNTFTVQQ